MSFPRIKITDSGRALMARVFAGERLQFTHFSIGSGECGNVEDWEGLTSLINHEMDVEISDFQRDGDIVSLRGEFANGVVEGAFWWRELGIYATLPDVADYGNVMCFYGNAEELAEYVPGAEATVSVTHRWDTTLMVSGTADVSAIVHSITYVTSEQLNSHVNDPNNPHKVSAAQVGLGNVPNVATNDQTPTFAATTVLAELVSGEKLSLSFGKIAGAIKNLIAHVTNKNNPHSVTISQIDAAATNHRSTGTNYGMANESYFGHAKITDDTTKNSGASDGIAASPKFVRKLTGEMKYAGSSTVGGAATSAVKLSTARKVTVNLESESGAEFDGSKEISPGVSGVLPIKHGGLGASTAEEARRNLGIITLDEIPNLYVWKKYTGNPSKPKETDTPYAQISWRNPDGGTYTKGGTITYADGAKLEDGEVVLDGETKTLTYSSASSDVSVLLGKYVQSTGNSLISDIYDGIYYIPENATLTPSSTGLGANNIYKLTVPEYLGYVSSKERTEYSAGTNADGNWYEYHKQLGE